MKTVMFYHGDELRLGVKVEDSIIDVKEATKHFPNLNGIPITAEELLTGGDLARLALEQMLLDIHLDADYVYPETSLDFGPCVPHPQKIICVGLNYKKHADECNMPYPKTPILFSKFANTLAGHGDVIELPLESQQVDYEAELVIVIGKEAKNVSETEALEYVFGYCNGNDLSARDLQFTTTQWLLGKTSDGFCPIGPYLVSRDEIDNPNDLAIGLTLNGEVRQISSTSDMIYNCEDIISYISKHMTLYPGDIILTGTPEGVIMGEPEESRKWLSQGDEMTVTIENLGSLTNVIK
ncbi:fumarylacetoacetate hydrolase family protein [Bacillus alkalicellulosilyticus]|uniref:fumarylacetoacetate hydrolase family protein n=1 Tax=Alkalihalobacterium alkalicellulosilyticum TaxID=1912214 RepID=UPI000995EF62|nr:fumarylacetoacetate hydrolase family protein [Bacillus alkalicellulosilyticus]